LFDPIQTTKTSVSGAINMFGLAKRLKVRILQASTSEVYGDPLVHPQTEDYWAMSLRMAAGPAAARASAALAPERAWRERRGRHENAALNRPMIKGTAEGASSASLFLLALEAGLQDDVPSDLKPLQQDDEIGKSEGWSERGGFGDNPAREVRAASWNSRRKPRPRIVQGLKRVYIMPRRRHFPQEQLRMRDQMIHNHFAA